MTKFEKSQFHFFGGYLTYKGQFIARFKYQKGDRATFQSFLIKNFTVEEYTAQQTAGLAPATILETKGYVSATVRKALRRAGYPETQQGFKDLISAQIAARKAA
jgi:hypothetical protein